MALDAKPRWIKMSLAELTTPAPGRMVMGPRWWAVTDDGCALFFRSHGSPQCNVDKRIVERLLGRQDYPGNPTPQFVELAFLPHRCSDYC